MKILMSATLAVALFLFPALAFGQGAVQQSGVVVPGHPSCWGTNGVIYDCGPPYTLPRYTVGTLPTCNSINVGALAYVTDALSPTYNGALTGGGAVTVSVLCNGSAWVSA